MPRFRTHVNAKNWEFSIPAQAQSDALRRVLLQYRGIVRRRIIQKIDVAFN